MTKSEAIEELKHDCNELGKAIPCDTGWGMAMNEAYRMAISALETDLRPCIVEMIVSPAKKARGCGIVEAKTETHKGYFHTWGSDAYVTNGYLVGTAPGQVSTLYGVVEYEDGTVHRVPPECITFTDREGNV